MTHSVQYYIELTCFKPLVYEGELHFLPYPMSFFFFLNKVVLVPCLWMHKGWHLYCTDKAWHLHWYKARHRSMCASLLFLLYFWCSLFSVIRVLSWETSKASKSFTFPPADPLHIMFWLSKETLFPTLSCKGRGNFDLRREDFFTGIVLQEILLSSLRCCFIGQINQ